MPNPTPQPGTPADDFTGPEIAAQLEATLQDLVGLEAKWPALVSLEGAERNGSLGKLIARLSPALTGLFEAITPVAGEDPVKTEVKQKLAKIFDSSLGAHDGGKDPAVFEVELLVRRIARIEAEQKIVERLERLTKIFADDILNTGTLVVEPGLKAIGVARGLADTSDEFRSALAPLTNTLSDLTKAARAAQAEARKAAKAKKEEPPK